MLVLLLQFFTDRLLPSKIYIFDDKQLPGMRFLRGGCNNFHRYVGEIFRWNGHVPERYLPGTTAAALPRLLLTLVMVLFYW